MEVYAELALAENFCMDFTLLYAAKIAVKNRAGMKRIALAAALGACFAVVLPLLNIPTAVAVALKLTSGLLLCLTAGRYGKVGAYVKFTGVFFAFTALLGGALIGLFSLAGTQYEAGRGYLLSSVPVGIPLFGALMLVLGARRIAARLKKSQKTEVRCRIVAGEYSVEVNGFYDSGNKVYLHGEPVSVVPQSVARKLDADARMIGRVKIHTVTGSRLMDVFSADKLVIDQGGKIKEIKGVRLGVSPARVDGAVLHPDLAED